MINMNRQIFFFIIPISIFGAILVLGNAGGAALIQKLDRTGSPLSEGPCQACHSNGNFNPNIDIKLMDGGDPVLSYMPGEVYTLQVVVNANPNAQQFGFQAVALHGSGNIQAGTFQNPPVGIAIRTVNNRSYPEQKFPSLQDTFRVEWVAPAAGTGDVKIYAAGVATNANGNSSGDGSAFSNITIQENGASEINNLTAISVQILSHLPGQFIDIQTPDQQGLITLVDLQGRYVQSMHAQGSLPMRIDLQGLMPGIYLLHYRGQTGTWTEKLHIP